MSNENLQQAPINDPSSPLSSTELGLASSAIYPVSSPMSSTPIINDDRAISSLLETILNRSGLSVSEVARRMGVTGATVRFYLAGRVPKVGLRWFIRFTQACGGQLRLELPPRKY